MKLVQVEKNLQKNLYESLKLLESENVKEFKLVRNSLHVYFLEKIENNIF